MHTIRLREPWRVETAPDRVTYQRHFNRPTGLTPGDVVRLAMDGLPLGASVRFNDQPLPTTSPAAWDITAALQLRNAVTIEIATEKGPADQFPFSEVRLEIDARSV